jgi:hypothetical protein
VSEGSSRLAIVALGNVSVRSSRSAIVALGNVSVRSNIAGNTQQELLANSTNASKIQD